MKKISLNFALLLMSTMQMVIATFPCQSQPIIKVHGPNQLATAEALVSECLNQLNVHEDFYLIVRFSVRMSRTQPGFTTYQENTSEDARPIIWVWIKANLNKNLQRKVLIHEMIHVKQFAKGELIMVNHNNMIWNGKNIAYDAGNKNATPWEFEAHRDDGLLAKRIGNLSPRPLLAKQSSK